MALTRGVVASFVVGVGVGAGGCFLYISSSKAPLPSQHKRDSERRHHALKHGVPISDVLREYKGFVAAFDTRTRNPKWVIEHITAESAGGEGDRSKSDFYEDKDIAPEMRNKLTDFRGSGYDRGHLAPAANHKGSQEAMNETFTLSNISPQVGQGFNRDYWARFEKFVKDLTRKCDDVYVVTGPLWLPTGQDPDGRWFTKYPLLGEPPSLVSVPTHFFKVVLAQGHKEKEGLKEPLVAAFAMPNAPIDAKTPLAAFVVPLEAVEAAAGTRFFPETVTAHRRRVLDDAAHAWRAHGLQQLRPFDRQSLIETTPSLLALPSSSSSSTATAPATVEVLSVSAPVNAAAPALAAATATPAAVAEVTPAPAAGKGAPTPVIKTRAGYGVLHLCEEIACRLPPEKFWEGANSNSDQGRRNGGSRGGGGTSRGRRS